MSRSRPRGTELLTHLTEPLNGKSDSNETSPSSSRRSILSLLKDKKQKPSDVELSSVRIDSPSDGEEDSQSQYVPPRLKLQRTISFSDVTNETKSSDENGLSDIELASPNTQLFHGHETPTSESGTSNTSLSNGSPLESDDDTPSFLDLTKEQKEELALYVLGHAKDNLKPLKGKEYLIVIPAVIVSLAACVTSKDFGDKFVQGLESLLTSFQASDKTIKDGLAWGIAAANTCAQFSLSSNSAINVFTRLLRSYQRKTNKTADKYERNLNKLEKTLLGIVPLSAFATWKMGYDTLHNKYELSQGVAHTTGILRFGSAATVNLNFTYDQIYRWRGDSDDLALVRLLKAGQKRLKTLLTGPNPNPIGFIEALGSNDLLKNLNKVKNVSNHETLENIVKELLATNSYKEEEKTITSCSDFTKENCITWISLLLGALVSLTNYKAGAQAPNLLPTDSLGLPTLPSNLIDYFKNIKTAEGAYIGMVVVGMCLGIPSWFINTIINTRSCKNLAKSLTGFVGDARDRGVINALRPYLSKDGAIFALISLASMGYGAGNGGSSYKYPLLNSAPVPFIQMCLSTIVFTGLGNLAQQGAVGKARDWWDRDLLKRALNADDLLSLYTDELSPAEQAILNRLLINNINNAFDTLVTAISKQDKAAMNSLFSPELRNKLEEKFGTELREIVTHTPQEENRQPSPPLSPNLTAIRIDRLPTREEREALQSIRIDPPSPTSMRRVPSSKTGIGFEATFFTPNQSPTQTTEPPHQYPTIPEINTFQLPPSNRNQGSKR